MIIVKLLTQATANVVKFIVYFKWIFMAHIRACIVPFDTIIDAPKEITLANKRELIAYEQSRPLQEYSKYFRAPFAIYVAYLYETAWVMVKHDFNYPADPMPEWLGHKMFPRMFWPQSDVILNAAMSGLFVQYYYFCRNDWLNERFCMFLVDDAGEKKLIVDRKVWDQANAEKMLKLRDRNKKFQKYVYFITFAVASVYFDFHFLRRPWNDGWRDWYHFILILHQICWYNLSAMFYSYFHFFLITQYIITKQKLMNSKLEEVVRTLNNDRKRKRSSLAQLWYQFRVVNSELAYQCAEIRAYNRFWSIHLSLQFLFAVIMICFAVYSNLFLFKEATIEAMFYFVFYPIQFISMMFLVIFVCSWVDGNNKKSYALNVKACMAFQFHYDYIPHRMLAQIETISTNRNFSRCCFRLVNGYRLDSTAFNMAIYIISTLFIMLVKRSDYYQKGNVHVLR